MNRQEENQFDFESIEDRETIVRFFQSLMAGMKSQKIVLSSENQSITLSPHALIGFTVRAVKTGDRSRLSIQLEWREDSPAHGPLDVMTE